jgi:hypothetical protein
LAGALSAVAADAREVVGPNRSSEQSVAVQAARQDMEEKAADELGGVESSPATLVGPVA